jgi:hypothetical protein
MQEEADSDSLLRVQIESSIQKTTFYVPVSLMLQREVEMLESAKRDGIDSERWSASRLLSLWKENSRQEEITLLLTPEVSMKDHSTLKWEPWLSSCIRAYYNTGTIRIPDDALGSEILLALEYFGILTTTADQFVFDSYDAFQRVKQWSDYFTLRDLIAAWVLDNLKAKGTGRRTWVTSGNAMDMLATEVVMLVSGDYATLLTGGLEDSGYGLSCRVVNGIFKDKETGKQLTRQVQGRMRQDFCDLLKRSLPPRTKVTFDTCNVRITKTSTGRECMEARPTLKIQREGEPDSSKHTHEASNGSSAKKSERSKPLSAGEIFGSSHEKQFKQEKKGIFGSEDSTHRSSVTSRTRDVMNSYEQTAGNDARIGGAYGSRETLVLSSSNLYDQIAGYEPTNGGAYGFQQHFPDSSDKASARSKHDASGRPSPIAKSRSVVTTHTIPSAVEQRHPQRSSPPPDERRVSPENVVDKRQTISDREFLQQIDAVAPVRFVNMSLGDLRSVTSGLSGTFMDESVFDATEAREVPHRKPAFQPALPISMEHESSPSHESRKSSPELKLDEAKLLKSLESFKGESRDSGVSCNYWDKWLAGVCEAMIPGNLPGERSRSSSPTQQMTIATAEIAEETTGHTTVSTPPLKVKPSEETRVKRNTPRQAARRNTPTQSRIGSVSMQSQIASHVSSDEEAACGTGTVDRMAAKWLRPTIRSKETAPFGGEMLQQAGTVVRNISNEFDGLMKQALSSNSRESNSSPNQSEKKSRSIPKKLPMPTNKTLPKELPMPTNKTPGTERSAKVKNTLPARPRACAQANPSEFGALVITHIQSAEEGTKDGGGVRKGSSDLSSEKKNEGFVLPPREHITRMRVNARSIIARKKKQSASGAPPRSASRSSGVSMNPSQISSESFRSAPITHPLPGSLIPISSISQSTGGNSEVIPSSKKSRGRSIARRLKTKIRATTPDITL